MTTEFLIWFDQVCWGSNRSSVFEMTKEKSCKREMIDGKIDHQSILLKYKRKNIPGSADSLRNKTNETFWSKESESGKKIVKGNRRISNQRWWFIVSVGKKHRFNKHCSVSTIDTAIYFWFGNIERTRTKDWSEEDTKLASFDEEGIEWNRIQSKKQNKRIQVLETAKMKSNIQK